MFRFHFLCIMCALSVSSLHLFVATAATDDNCILSFVVPRDKVKSSCQSDDKVNRQLGAVEMKVNLYKQQVSDMQTQLNKQRQLYSGKLETMEQQINSLSARTTDMVVQLEGRLALLEKVFEQSSKDVKHKPGQATPTLEGARLASLPVNSIDSATAILTNMVKSMIQSEMSEYFQNFTKNVETYVKEQIFLYNKVFNILPRRREAFQQQSQHSAPLQLQTSAVRDKEQTRQDSLSGALLEHYDNSNNNNEQVKTQLNYTSDQINNKPVGTYVKNSTKVGYNEVSEHGKLVIGNEEKKGHNQKATHVHNTPRKNLSQHKEPFSGNQPDVNDTSLKNPFTSSIKGVSSSRISQHILANNHSTESGLHDNDSHKKLENNMHSELNYNTVTEVEDRLKNEVTAMLYTSLAKILSLIEEQKAALETKIALQGYKCEQLSTDLTVHRQHIENSIETTNQHMQTLYADVRDLFPKVDRIQPLEVLVSEIKNSIIANRSAYLIEHEEQSKKLKKIERLMGVYPQSMEHYRNETKHEYREIKESLDKEANILRTSLSSLQNNVTDTVSGAINRLNTSHMVRFQEVNDQIRAHEDTLLSVQADLEKAEKLLQNRPKRSDRDFQDLQETVSDLSLEHGDLKKAIDRMEQAQSGMNGTMSFYFQEVSALKIEVKLNYNEWLPLTFEFDSSRTDCFGDQYVRRTYFSKTRLVGVILCSPTRYKIFLSTSLQNTFLNIGDGNGMGEDHCEFVGGNKDWQVKLSPFKPSFEAVQGYARNQWGQEPVVSYLNAIKPSPHWYECGVKVP